MEKKLIKRNINWNFIEDDIFKIIMCCEDEDKYSTKSLTDKTIAIKKSIIRVYLTSIEPKIPFNNDNDDINIMIEDIILKNIIDVGDKYIQLNYLEFKKNFLNHIKSKEFNKSILENITNKAIKKLGNKIQFRDIIINKEISKLDKQIKQLEKMKNNIYKNIVNGL